MGDLLDGAFLLFCNLLLGGIFLSAFFANLLVLLAFYRKSGLRSVANRFVVNLMVINLLSCTSLLPLSLADNTLTSDDTVLCLATELSSVFCSSVIVYAVLLIAIDQYFAIVDPLHYHRVVSSEKSNWMIVSSWCVSAAFAVMDGVQPSIDRGGYSVFRHCGLHNDTASLPEERTVFRYVFCSAYAASAFVVPFVLICLIYYRICVAASGNGKRARTVRAEEPGKVDAGRDEAHKQQETASLLEAGDGHGPSFVVTRPSPPRTMQEEAYRPETPFLKPTLKYNSSLTKLTSVHIQFSRETDRTEVERRHSASAEPELRGALEGRSPLRPSRSSSLNSNCRHPPSRASSVRSTSSYVIHSIRHRISNASLFRYREEARTARVSALVIVMALVCWLPFFTVFYLHSGIRGEIYGARAFPVYLDAFSIAFLLLSAVVSPFLFAFRNRKIRNEIRKILRCCRVRADCAKSFYKYNFSVEMEASKPGLVLPANRTSPGSGAVPR